MEFNYKRFKLSDRSEAELFKTFDKEQVNENENRRMKLTTERGIE